MTVESLRKAPVNTLAIEPLLLLEPDDHRLLRLRLCPSSSVVVSVTLTSEGFTYLYLESFATAEVSDLLMFPLPPLP